MTTNIVVLLIVGALLLVYLNARGKGYSSNQRVVLTAVAIGLLLWTFIRRGEAGGLIIAAVAVVTLVVSVLYLRNRN